MRDGRQSNTSQKLPDDQCCHLADKALKLGVQSTTEKQVAVERCQRHGYLVNVAGFELSCNLQNE